MRLWALFLLAAAFSVACGSSESSSSTGSSSPGERPGVDAPPASATAAARSPWGVTISPRGDDWLGFFEEAAEFRDVVGWYGDWAEMESPEGAPHVIASLAADYALEPLFIATPYSLETGLLRPLDEAQREAYVAAAAEFAERHQPRYLGLGIEVNVLYEKWPGDFEAFVTLFEEAAAAVKAASPDTLVFTVFQLERMKGLQGGLFGGQNDAALAQWELIDRFPSADLVAFTTYPGLIFQTPEEIPEDYFSELTSRVSKPLAFTEIGWPADMDVEGWESDEAEQAAFVSRFVELTQGLDAELLIWAFLYDPQGAAIPLPFQTMGLRRPDGTARPAWDVLTSGR